MKRIFLFLVTNIAILLVLSVTLRLLGVDRILDAQGTGLNYNALLVMAGVIGFGGSFISLLISKPMAKWSTGAQVIDAPANSTELWLLDTVQKLSDRAGGVGHVSIPPRRTPQSPYRPAPTMKWTKLVFRLQLR